MFEFEWLNERFPSWRRDLVAQAIVASVVVLFVMNNGAGDNRTTGDKGGVSGGAKKTPTLFGTVEANAAAATDATQRALVSKDKPGVEREKATPVPDEKPEAAAKPPMPEPPKPEPKPLPKVKSEWVDRADQSLAVAPAATEVEKKPKAAKAMSDQEKAETLRSYQQWVHDGQVKVRLDFSEVNVKQMEPAISFFILNSSNTSGLRFRVGPGTEVETMKELPRGKLIGDLPDSHWPPRLAAAATVCLGQNYRAHANIILADDLQLRIYRLLAFAVAEKKASSDEEFVMRLQPSRHPNEVDLSLVKRTAVKPPVQ